MISSTIITLFAGALITYLIALWQMRKKQIRHFLINSYDIGEELKKEFPQFNIQYNNKNIEKHVNVLKGGFINISRNDITSVKGDNSIKLILPSDCNILAINISTEDNLLINGVILDDNKNIVSFNIGDLFKSDEYFKYTAIIESSEIIDNFSDKLKFKHRIPDTKKIYNTYIGELSKLKKFRKIKWILITFIFISFIGATLPLLFNFQEVKYKVIDNKSQEYDLYIDNKSQLYITQSKIFPFFDKNQTNKSELETNYNISPDYSYKWFNIELIYVILYIILCIYFIWFYYRIIGKKNHIIKILDKGI